MKLVGVISTAVLTLALGTAAPAYAQQEPHDQQEEKEKPAEKKAQPEKPAKAPEKSAQEDRNAKPEEKNARQQEAKPEAKSEARPEAKSGAPAQRAGGNRIPDDKYKANFGQGHTFRVSQGDYRNHRFQYGGYSFGFVGVWPSNWLYTQDVYVIDIDGVYYLCNPTYPGVNIALSFTL